MDQIFDKIITTTFTTSQLIRRVDLLREYYVEHFFAGKEVNLESLVTNQSDLEWFQLNKAFLDGQISQGNVYQTLEALEAQAKMLEVIIIIIAFEIPDAAIAKMCQSLRQEHRRNFIFEVRIDGRLIAGCCFIINGEYKDYSVKKAIQEKQQEIVTRVKEVIGQNGN